MWWGNEAAIQEEVDALVRRRREAVKAQEEYNDKCRYTN